MPHRLREGDTDEHVVDARAEVRSTWGKVDKFLERFGRLLLTVVIAISSWFLANVVKPLKQVPALMQTTQTLRADQDSTNRKFDVINRKLDEANIDRSRMVDILGVLASLQCDSFTQRERRTSKLCGKLLNGELP